jgi:hypothetical protein
MRQKLLLSALTLTLMFSGCRQSDWHDLFNGNDFTGFVQKGGQAQFIAENGVMVGISTPDTPNSFMCTTGEYSDFILEFEVKVDTLLNSGVQVRSHSLDNDGRELVYGYQVEIDPTDRAWSGGIYDEARRGWLYPVTPNNQAAVRSFDRQGWNSYRVEAIGSRIRTWINGIPVADLIDDTDSSGFIGFQVHAVADALAGTRVEWKNIRIVTENLDKYSWPDTSGIYTRQTSYLIPLLKGKRQMAGSFCLTEKPLTAGAEHIRRLFLNQDGSLKTAALKCLPQAVPSQRPAAILSPLISTATLIFHSNSL